MHADSNFESTHSQSQTGWPGRRRNSHGLILEFEKWCKQVRVDSKKNGMMKSQITIQGCPSKKAAVLMLPVRQTKSNISSIQATKTKMWPSPNAGSQQTVVDAWPLRARSGIAIPPSTCRRMESSYWSWKVPAIAAFPGVSAIQPLLSQILVTVWLLNKEWRPS